MYEIFYNPVNAAKLVGQYDVLVSVIGPPGTPPEQLQQQAGLLSSIPRTAKQTSPRPTSADLITESIDPVTGADEVRRTRFTRVAFDSSGYQDAIAIGLIRSETSELDVLGFSDLIDDRLAPDERRSR